MMAKDTVYNTMGFFLARSYLTLPQAGSKSGIYCLQEKEGRVDVDVFGSKRTLIFSGSQAEEYWHEQDYWSGLHPEHPLDGEDFLFYYGKMVLYPDRTGGFALFTCEYGDYGYLERYVLFSARIRS